VKVTRPWELVAACGEDDRHDVKAGGATTTLTPDTGFPWLSTTLIDIVTFGGQTGTMVDEIVVVMAVVAVEAVDTRIDVEVVENIPP
jgi:hypothetical protein